jgi:hypothetical protein
MQEPLPRGASQSDVSRREFIGKGLVATGALAGVAASQDFVLRQHELPKVGDKEKIPDSRPVRLGVIGVGGMGWGHVRAHIGLNKRKRYKAEVVAVCDVCKTRLDSVVKATREQQPGVELTGYRYYPNCSSARTSMPCSSHRPSTGMPRWRSTPSTPARTSTLRSR